MRVIIKFLLYNMLQRSGKEKRGVLEGEIQTDSIPSTARDEGGREAGEMQTTSSP